MTLIGLNSNVFTPVATGDAPAVTPTSPDVSGTSGNLNLVVGSKTYTPTAPNTADVTGSNDPTGSNNPTGSGGPSGKPETLTYYGITCYLYDGYYYDRPVKNSNEAQAAVPMGSNEAAVESSCDKKKKTDEFMALPFMDNSKISFQSADALTRAFDAGQLKIGSSYTYKNGDGRVFEAKVSYEPPKPSGSTNIDWAKAGGSVLDYGKVVGRYTNNMISW